MRISEIDTLYAYNWWATERILNAARGMSDEDFTSIATVPLPFGSLRDTLVHILDTERSARLLLSGHLERNALDPATFASVDDLTRFWRAEATAMNDYLSGLLDEVLDREFVLNDAERYPYWQLLVHFVNHSTQHRSEAAILLTELGRSPGDLDIYLFLREAGK
jgi:uncharacterized damage-inducible protein DinB